MPTETPFFARRSEREIADWLLRGVLTGEYEGYEMKAEPWPPSQLERLVLDQPFDDQQRFKRAILTAIAEWKSADALGALRTLAVLGAYVRTVDVVPLLANIARHRLLPRLRSAEGAEGEEVRDVLGAVLAVISGFAPHPSATTAAESFYYDDRLPPPLTAIVLHALCRAAPGDYPRYLPRIIRLIDRDRRAFHLGLLLDRMVDTISPPVFAKHLPELDREVLPTLVELINTTPRIRVRIEVDEKSYNVITSFSGEETLYECPAPKAKKAEDLSPVYDPLIGTYGGVKELDALLGLVPQLRASARQQQ